MFLKIASIAFECQYQIFAAKNQFLLPGRETAATADIRIVSNIFACGTSPCQLG
jgi:hypothetical protein